MTDDRIAIGLIRTSYGLKGDLKVKSLSGETKHFFHLKHVFLKKEDGRFLQLNVEAVREVHANLIIKLEGIDTPEKGKQFNGCELWVERDLANPIEEDEYYYADLCLCSAFLDGKELGRIKSVVDGPQTTLLEVVTSDGKTVLVPFIEEYVGTVDIENKKIILKEASKEL